ncbi:MAG: DUF1273 domain-containing protein [Oscillospiraceae bacterium]|nr:DUF1273 domain-containing protein [Oscillospiraceae bacterium]
MNPKTCCFTGHRKISASQYPEIQKHLEAELEKLINQGVDVFMAGGALGFDTIAALTVLAMKKDYPQISLFLVLPCMEQAKSWCGEDLKTYSRILNEADNVVYTSDYYFPGCMQKRNRRLVDSSGVCLCFLTKGGGTAYTVAYAQKKGVQIVNLADFLSLPALSCKANKNADNAC